jgi:hypothetical protein
MRPRVALILVAVVAAGLIASLFIADRGALVNRVNLENPPEVLAARAREIIVQMGISGTAADSAYGFDTDGAYLAYIQEHDKSPGRWTVLSADRPAAMVFWYRQSPRELVTGQFYGPGPGSGRVSPTDPPMNVTGMVLVVLDMRGRLLRLQAVPPQRDPPINSSIPIAWPGLFSAAGLESAAFRSADSEWMPLAWGDSRAAWTGMLPGRPDLPVRIEAAAYRGKPIYFDTI